MLVLASLASCSTRAVPPRLRKTAPTLLFSSVMMRPWSASGAVAPVVSPVFGGQSGSLRRFPAPGAKGAFLKVWRAPSD